MTDFEKINLTLKAADILAFLRFIDNAEEHSRNIIELSKEASYYRQYSAKQLRDWTLSYIANGGNIT